MINIYIGIKLKKLSMNNIDRIISEEMTRINESSNKEISDLIKGYLSKRGKDGSKSKKNKKKLRKKAKGGKEYYDYGDYERKNVKVSKGDADSIRDAVDTDTTNMAAVARKIFPDHTEEGAQSQLRKVINGERPMTKTVANKIDNLISSGKIAVN